jgi:hypothetical protein
MNPEIPVVVVNDLEVGFERIFYFAHFRKNLVFSH